MKKIIISLAAFIVCSSSFAEPAKLRYTQEFILDEVLKLMKIEKRDEVPIPEFYYSSNTSLEQFQDALERQWNMRSEYFTNAFSAENNEIYIVDDSEYYQRTGRCMDDSVAHELVHFIQSKYRGWSLKDPGQEWEAVRYQKMFREKFCK